MKSLRVKFKHFYHYLYPYFIKINKKKKQFIKLFVFLYMKQPKTEMKQMSE